MNYYEELGIRSDADEEEIRKAHRRLVKLMHPDQHRDAALKALAETQMRRLNSIVSTLLNAEEREEYDEQLRGGVNGSDPSNHAPQQSTWRSIPWWIASTLGAIVLTVGAVWFFADRLGSSFTAHNNPPKVDVGPGDFSTPPEEPKPEAPKLPEVKLPEVKLPEVKPPEVKPEVKVEEKKPVPPPPPPQVVVAKEIPKALPKPALPPPTAPAKIAKVISPQVVAKPLPKKVKPQPVVVAKQQSPPQQKPAIAVQPPPAVVTPPPAQPKKEQTLEAVNAPPPAPTPTPAPAAPPPAAPSDNPKPEYHAPTAAPPATTYNGRNHDPLEGEWVYAPTEPPKRKPGLFPPEFIQLKLVKDTSGMHGEYSARYNVDKPVSPDVNFVLKATDDTAMKYIWTAANGAHGWFVIRNLETDTMRLEWRDTSKRNGQLALTSGIATLVRKN